VELDVHSFHYSFQNQKQVIEPFPECILVKMESNKEVSPIFPISDTQFDCISGKKITIKHYPIRLAYSQSVFRCQGQTYEKVILKLYEKEPWPGYTYTIISRVRHIKDVAIISSKITKERFTDPSFFKLQEEQKSEAIRIGMFETIYG
jgi:hypothetical protein